MNQCLTYGVIGAIVIMILEMILFISRAVRMEQSFEQAPTGSKLYQAQKRSGSLLTAPAPNVSGVVHAKLD